MVAETGSRGGYRYRFDTGLDGETWFVAHSTNSKNWNIRVSVKSLALSLYGYEGVKERILNRLKALKAIGQSRKISGSEEVTNMPLDQPLAPKKSGRLRHLHKARQTLSLFRLFLNLYSFLKV